MAKQEASSGGPGNWQAALIGLREDYPQLTADGAARGLFDRLTALENEVALMRDGYNNAVKSYNQRLATIPENVIALLTGCRPAPYLNELREGGP